MRTFAQLDNNGIVGATVSFAIGSPDAAFLANTKFIEVTGRVDGPFDGLKYDAPSSTFVSPAKGRPITHITATHVDKTPDTFFDVNEAITINVEIRLPDDSATFTTFETVVGKSVFIVNVGGPSGLIPVKFTFSGGKSAKTVSLTQPGIYSVDQNASALVKIAPFQISIVL